MASRSATSLACCRRCGWGFGVALAAGMAHALPGKHCGCSLLCLPAAPAPGAHARHPAKRCLPLLTRAVCPHAPPCKVHLPPPPSHSVHTQFFDRMGLSKLRFKPAFNPYTEPSMEIFRQVGPAWLWSARQGGRMSAPPLQHGLLSSETREDAHVQASGTIPTGMQNCHQCQLTTPIDDFLPAAGQAQRGSLPLPAHRRG